MTPVVAFTTRALCIEFQKQNTYAFLKLECNTAW